MKISTDEAEKIFRNEAKLAETGPIDAIWEGYVEHLSKLCSQGVSSTHIAFLGASILAKATDTSADLYAIKPNHAKDNPNAYSARSLCHSVLVPLAAELGVSIGVTGREPLNNQPYFRMTRLGDETPVHAGGKAAFDYMVTLIDKLHAMNQKATAAKVLRAFIAVRRRYRVQYTTGIGAVTVTPERLVKCIEALVTEDSENGARAQAVVAGLFDVFAGTSRVESGRINDPSRKHPGDVCVRAPDNTWEKAIEVRDKIVKPSDVYIFGAKCIEMGVREAAIVMTFPKQKPIDIDTLAEWTAQVGIGLTLFYGWRSIVEQSLFWATKPTPGAAIEAVSRIEERLIAVEATSAAVQLWQKLVRR